MGRLKWRSQDCFGLKVPDLTPLRCLLLEERERAVTANIATWVGYRTKLEVMGMHLVGGSGIRVEGAVLTGPNDCRQICACGFGSPYTHARFGSSTGGVGDGSARHRVDGPT